MRKTTPEEKKKAQRIRYERWKARNPGAGTEASRKRRKELGYTPWPAKREMGIWVNNYKATTPCTDCAKTFPAECMDFDHVQGVKKYCVGTMVAHGHNREKIMDEISKCELVCSNCHRIRTRRRKLYGTTAISGISENS